jgi:hypothetical protein
MIYEPKNLTREAIAAWLKGEEFWHLLSGHECKWSDKAASSTQCCPWTKYHNKLIFSRLMAQFLGYTND